MSLDSELPLEGIVPSGREANSSNMSILLANQIVCTQTNLTSKLICVAELEDKVQTRLSSNNNKSIH
jgi:hypothetical protein